MPTGSSIRESIDPQLARSGMAVEMWALEAAAAWMVRRGLERAYRAATGGVAPAADDTGAPLRRVLMWTVLTAASVAAADALVDQLVLRKSRWNRVIARQPGSATASDALA